MILRSDIYSRRGTAIIKGLAILCMLYLHLFGLFSLEPDVAQAAMSDAHFAQWAANATKGKVCISLFAFVTGFGYCIISQRDTRGIVSAAVSRLRRFYPFYAAFVLAIAALSFIAPWPMTDTPIIPEHLPNYLLTLIGAECALADFWYIAVVLVGALVFYPILLAAKRRGALFYTPAFIGLCIVSLPNFTLNCIYHLSAHLGYNPYDTTCASVGIPLIKAMSWMRYMLVGWALAALSREARKTAVCLVLSAAGLLAVSMMYSTENDLIFLGFLAVACALQYLPESWVRPMVLLGNYSACMWLNHRLIFGYWFADWFYSLPTPLNFFLLVALSFVASVIITKAWEAVISRLHRSKAA